MAWENFIGCYIFILVISIKIQSNETRIYFSSAQQPFATAQAQCGSFGGTVLAYGSEFIAGLQQCLSSPSAVYVGLPILRKTSECKTGQWDIETPINERSSDKHLAICSTFCRDNQYSYIGITSTTCFCSGQASYKSLTDKPCNLVGCPGNINDRCGSSDPLVYNKDQSDPHPSACRTKFWFPWGSTTMTIDGQCDAVLSFLCKEGESDEIECSLPDVSQTTTFGYTEMSTLSTAFEKNDTINSPTTTDDVTTKESTSFITSFQSAEDTTELSSPTTDKGYITETTVVMETGIESTTDKFTYDATTDMDKSSRNRDITSVVSEVSTLAEFTSTQYTSPSNEGGESSANNGHFSSDDSASNKSFTTSRVSQVTPSISDYSSSEMNTHVTQIVEQTKPSTTITKDVTFTTFDIQVNRSGSRESTYVFTSEQTTSGSVTFEKSRFSSWPVNGHTTMHTSPVPSKDGLPVDLFTNVASTLPTNFMTKQVSPASGNISSNKEPFTSDSRMTKVNKISSTEYFSHRFSTPTTKSTESYTNQRLAKTSTEEGTRDISPEHTTVTDTFVSSTSEAVPDSLESILQNSNIFEKNIEDQETTQSLVGIAIGVGAFLLFIILVLTLIIRACHERVIKENLQRALYKKKQRETPSSDCDLNPFRNMYNFTEGTNPFNKLRTYDTYHDCLFYPEYI